VCKDQVIGFISLFFFSTGGCALLSSLGHSDHCSIFHIARGVVVWLSELWDSFSFCVCFQWSVAAIIRVLPRGTLSECDYMYFICLKNRRYLPTPTRRRQHGRGPRIRLYALLLLFQIYLIGFSSVDSMWRWARGDKRTDIWACSSSLSCRLRGLCSRGFALASAKMARVERGWLYSLDSPERIREAGEECILGQSHSNRLQRPTAYYPTYNTSH